MYLGLVGIDVKRVITYGTFDLLHYGHINLLGSVRPNLTRSAVRRSGK